ncbi:MAG: hypothetical protein MJA28_00620 [Gammaproteobacteria bacterium]|nr:hypothetical protein [Gammaproteobacteria bacterium]
MSHYKPKRIRWGKIVAGFFRSLAGILERWPLLLIAVFILSPVGPHMLLNYTYEQRGSYKYMLSCQYLGSRGFVHYVAMGECPYFKIIDSREFPKR